MQQLAPHLGGRTGAITSGAATTAVLAGLIGYPDVGVGDLLLMPDAANDGDQVRAITAWAASTGTATFATRTDTTYTSENYILLPRGADWTVDDLREAINETLRRTRYSYRSVIPSRDDVREYLLTAGYLRFDADIDGVYKRDAPGLLLNEDFTNWQAGASAAPDEWTLTGSAATITRSTTFASRGAYVAQVIRAGTDARLRQIVQYQVARQLIEDLADVAVSVRCVATAASRVRVGINNGVDTTWSSYHTGGSNLETLTATRTLTAAATAINVDLVVETGDITGSFDAAYLVEGTSVPSSFSAAGSEAYPLTPVRYQLVNRGEVPALILQSPLGRNQQIVMQARLTFAELSADSGATDCPEELLLHGALYRLFSKHKPGEDRTRLDRMATLHGKAYRTLAAGLIDRPAPNTMRQAVVGAA